MSILLQKIVIWLLIILFFSLPIVNSHLLSLFWLDFWYHVDWNYEFTKTMFFNIFIWLIFLIFWLEKLISSKEKDSWLSTNSIIYIIISFVIIWISTFFSISPYISLFWNSAKWHWAIMFIALILLFIIWVNQKRKTQKLIVNSFIIWVFISAIIAIKEYFLPSLNYGDLWNRALWTMWHPNYLALILLITIVPIYKRLISKVNNYRFFDYFLYIVLITLIVCLFLTKSALAIWLFILYNFFYIINSSRLIDYKKIISVIFWLIFIWFIWFTFHFYPEKIHSFISRFFIWETTICILKSDIKSFFTWWWLDTLDLIFNKTKNLYLYIFENIWYTADRPHNFILNIFYHFWLIWVLFLFYTFYLIYKYYKKLKFVWSTKIMYVKWLLIAFLFTFFNFPSIVAYIIIVLFLSIIVKETYKIEKLEKVWINFFWKITILLLISVSLWGAYYSSKYYIAETKAYNKDYNNAIKIFPYNPDYYYKTWKLNSWLEIWKYKSEMYYVSKIYLSKNIKESCQELINNFPTAENYFYCWNIMNKIWDKTWAKAFYNIGLSFLPDLWNKDSYYYNNFLKYFISTHRFFNEKFSNLKEILKIVNNKDY